MRRLRRRSPRRILMDRSPCPRTTTPATPAAMNGRNSSRSRPTPPPFAPTAARRPPVVALEPALDFCLRGRDFTLPITGAIRIRNRLRLMRVRRADRPVRRRNRADRPSRSRPNRGNDGSRVGDVDVNDVTAIDFPLQSRYPPRFVARDGVSAFFRMNPGRSTLSGGQSWRWFRVDR